MPGSHSEDREQERRQRHIGELKEKLERLAGQPVPMGFSPDCPDEVMEKFLESILAFEEKEQEPVFDALVKSGVQLPAPEEMDDRQLSSKLWEVIRGMALLGAYLHSTDHLSDRQLYQRLWTDLLREPTTLMPHIPDFACHIDITGSGSEEDLQLYLKYYADEESRREWARHWPGDNVPDHETPPYDRDRHLPGPPCC